MGMYSPLKHNSPSLGCEKDDLDHGDVSGLDFNQRREAPWLARLKQLQSNRLVLGCVSIVASCIVIGTIALSASSSHPAARCKSPPLRREWRQLDTTEKSRYIEAVKCLQTFPSELTGIGRRSDDFPWLHRHVAKSIHDTSMFLPYHRYVLHLYEKSLHELCDYEGVLPYWDWGLDWEDPTKSAIWDPETGFGGNGDADSKVTVGWGSCVTDGPLADYKVMFYNMVLELHCLSRGFGRCFGLNGTWSGDAFKPSAIEHVLRQTSFAEFSAALESGPHDAVPNNVCGDFYYLEAPNVFFLHHGNLDRLWKKWQDSEAGRTWEYNGPADSANLTEATVNDVLYMKGLGPDITVKEILDTESAIAICMLQLISLVHASSQHASSVALVQRLLFVLADAAVCMLSFFEHGRNTGPSTLLTAYLFFAIFSKALTAGLQLVAWNLCTISGLSAAVFTGRLFLFILESQTKRSILREPYNGLPAEATSGFLGVLFFWWVNKFLQTGYSKALSLADMPPLDESLDAVEIRDAMQQEWERKRNSKSRHALMLALLKTSWRPNIYVFIPRLLCTILRCCQPLLISRAIIFFSQELSPFEDRNEAFCLIFFTFIIYTGLPICNGAYTRLLARVNIVERMALVGAIYNDCLLVKEGVFDESAAVALMSNDVSGAAGFWDLFHDVWSQLLEVGIGMYMLAKELGWVCIFPVLVVFCISWVVEFITANLADRQVAFSRATQSRISTTKAVLDSMKNIKMMGLVEQMKTRIQGTRTYELEKFAAFYRLLLAFFTSSVALHLFSPAITLILYAVQAQIRGAKSVDTEMVFTSLAIIAIVATPANSLLGVFPEVASVLASFDRIQSYLRIPSREDRRQFIETSRPMSDQGQLSALPSAPNDKTTVKFDNVNIRPASTADLALKNISTMWKQGDLVVISGSVGSGKTTLAKALLGELLQDSGIIQTAHKTAAYCAQVAWLVNGTVREVICRLGNGRSIFDAVWYQRVVHACDLEEDFRQMPNGDQTVIGSRGITLSGGQKQRIALARAIFAREDIIILDDTLSALDASTQRHITNSLFGPNGLFKELGTTVVLITHTIQYLPLADHIIILDAKGGVAEQGAWNVLRAGTGYTSKIVLGHDNKEAEDLAPDRIKFGDGVLQELEKSDDIHQTTRATGDVTLYKYYFSAIGIPRLLLLLVSLTLYSIFVGIIPYWLKWMGESGGLYMWFYTGIYFLLSLGAFASVAVAISTIFLVIAPHSGHTLHERLLRTVMHAPQAYFATTDTGITLNRFSSDIRMIDRSLPFALFQVFQAIFLLLSQFILLCIVQPLIMITLPFTILAVYSIQKVYLTTSRQLRAVDLEARALVNSSFLETLEGVATIRAFGWQQAFSKDNAQKLDLSLRPDYMLTCVQRWLDLVLDLIVPGLAICVISLGVIFKGTTTGGQIGLALNVILQANRYILRLVSAWTSLETSLGAISRVRDFEQSVLPEEEPGRNPRPPPGWPAHGAVEFANVSASYHESALALDGITVTLAPGMKVGVVGRTGSGKTSLLLSLVRLVELQGSGKVRVDGLDICDLSRDAMRARIITVPQDPMLVKNDTVRQNLDIAAADLSDEEMVRVLERVGLWRVLLARRDRGNYSESSSVVPGDDTQKKSPLAQSVEAEDGEQLSCDESNNKLAADILDLTMESVPLSQGQQQLFSLARALLMRHLRGRLVLLDEATSSVDTETDKLMQGILREDFQDYTVITVAHRLDTIMDSDVVLAMHGGKLVEAGRPSELVEREGGLFRTLLSGKKLAL
ncbi:ABC multidrug transporter [Cordyceps javanica]|uniref:ABC multidrug transporter n=1 Tax=Cordyceps javanica TaxID=43265 RepID=A0A545UUT7_9HYPO|nr:ABC multidrug transporter [Cordyceps javanica]